MSTDIPGTEDAVYTGFWTDFDAGKILGASLTMTNANARIFMAFLAVIAGFSANRSWKIWRFSIHQVISDRQHRVILRNSETSSSALFKFIDLVYDTRPQSWRPRKRLAQILLLTAFMLGHWAAFVSFGILTSQVAKGSMVKSAITPTCGIWAPKYEFKNGTGEPVMLDAWQKGVVNHTAFSEFANQGSIERQIRFNETQSAENYMRNCYDDHARPIFDCKKFMVRSLKHSTESVDCPFDDGMCDTPDAKAFAMDSGNVSFSQLGINGKHAKSSYIRRRSICSPLVDQPFRYTNELKIQAFQRVNFTATSEELNQTHMYAYQMDTFGGPYGPNVTIVDQNTYGSSYRLHSAFTFGPFPVIRLRGIYEQANLTVIHLHSGTIHTSEPYSDGFFVFDTPLQMFGMSERLYRTSRPITTIACVEALMICLKSFNKCTNWLGISGSDYSGILDIMADVRGEDARDIGNFTVLTNILLPKTSISYVLGDRGSDVMVASRHLSLDGTQRHLFPEQWKLELRNWFSVGLAALQLGFYDTIQAPSDLDRENTQNLFDLVPFFKQLCGKVKFNSSQHTTMSTLGIVIILVTSVVLLLVSYLDEVFKKQLLESRILGEGMKRWESNEMLQLLSEADNAGLRSPAESDELKHAGTATVAERKSA